MNFVAILYSQSKLKEKIQLDDRTSLFPLGWSGLRDFDKGMQLIGGFKFAYIERDVKKPDIETIGFKNTKVKDFLEFISFITGDSWPIQEFEIRQEGVKYCNTMSEIDELLKEQKETEGSSNPNFIESNFSIRGSFGKPLGKMKISKAWNIFLSKEKKQRDMVSVLLARIVGPTNKIFEVFEKDTITIFMLITIIEGLLSDRIFCETGLLCNKCGGKNLRHYPETTRVFWEKALNDKLHFRDNTKYIKLIQSIYSNLRHAFAHTGELLDEAEYKKVPGAKGPHTRFMHFENVIESWGTDRLGRLNAQIVLQEITRLLLLSEYYPDHIAKPWPDIENLIKEYRTS